MKEKNILKMLVPVVAVVIILESVMLMIGSEKKTGLTKTDEDKGQLVNLSWEAVNETKMGVSEEVALKMGADEEVAVDAVDLYIKYDPAKVTVSDLSFDSKFVEPSFSKISQDKGLVVINYLVSAANGFKLKTGSLVDLAKLKVNYISAGEVVWEIASGTLVVENGTAKVLPFNSESLVINVSE